jgi:HMGL-like
MILLLRRMPSSIRSRPRRLPRLLQQTVRSWPLFSSVPLIERGFLTLLPSLSNGCKAGLSHKRNPFTRHYSDFLSNTSNWNIIESTLRGEGFRFARQTNPSLTRHLLPVLPKEGEQFANAFFDRETKIKIAKALSDFGVEYIELTSPASSAEVRRRLPVSWLWCCSPG